MIPTMKNSVSTLAALLALSLSALSQIQAAPAKPAKKIVDLKFCPMTMERATPDKTSQIVGSMRVNFCCPGCDTAFKNLSSKAKQAKIAAILKKQAKKS